MNYIAFGAGIRRKRDESVLDVWYPKIFWDQDLELMEALVTYKSIQSETSCFLELSYENIAELIQINKGFEAVFEGFQGPLSHSVEDYSTQSYGVFLLDNINSEIQNIEDAYFRLQALSQLKVKPHGINLNGIFGILNNIAWSNLGPILIDDLPQEQLKARLKNKVLEVSHVDKFPYMVDYFVPNGVRVVKGSQVRLGAHLAPGTTVMPAGYVNFNAGTLGNAMVEGRISAGVVVGEHTDLGGGASIMGTLSGGNNHVIKIGKHCLIGANAGTGISLGDYSTIAAGCYVTAGSKVRLYNENMEAVDLNGNHVENGQNIVKGSDLNEREKLLFLTDTKTGHLICRPNPKFIELNESLHNN